MAGAGLEVRNLAVGAAGGAILTGVNLTAAPGELVAVTGPSGCGKTTLLRTVAGLLDALSGTIHLDGHTPAAFGWPQYRRRVVLVDQQPVLLDRSVEENLKRPFSYQSANGGFPAARARTLLDRLGLEPDRWDQRARALSVGQQQRVCLVRALLLAPAVVLLDEPTSALDEAATGAAHVLLREEATERGLAAVVVTHNRQQAPEWRLPMTDLRTNMNGPRAANQEPRHEQS